MASRPTQTKTTAAKPAAKPAAKTVAKTAAKPAGAVRKKPTPAVQAPVVEVPVVEMPEAEVAEESGSAKKVGNLVVKLKDLVERITESSGAKKKDVKEIVEVTLAQLGAALARGETMSLQGFGHLRVARKATEENPVMTLKLRLSEAKAKAKSDDADAKEGLAEDSEAS